MNDKIKGLIVGLTIGSLLSGTAAFAAGTQIEVAFRNLKYMFDGVEKVPAEGKGFIYEGSTYVPLRFVSEALGKPVEWDEENETIWVGTNPNHIVATYNGGQLTRGELDTFMAIQAFLSPQSAGSSSDSKYQQFMAQQLIGLKILASRASEADVSTAKASAEKKLDDWHNEVPTFQEMLAEAKITESDLVNFLTTHISGQNMMISNTSDSEVQAKYDDALKANKDAYTHVSVRHILIGLKDPQSGSVIRSKDEALARAKELQQKLNSGGDFEALAKEYSDDPGSKDTGGLYEDADVNSWVESFKKAALELEIGVISDPVESEYGYHVMKVEARTAKSFDDEKAGLKSELVQEKLQNFRTNELPGLIEKIDLSQ
ncbi:peptidylprolyl isomerase [Paenibacillus hexagrammi]|uniref:Peptidylprolyl isomerase n=1 Tax=Paenibacillus hexagrammi TaxID=2908839 RepID=A0ABY3SPW7_9BACL|nr:peptidylprolyl isomerase [Paenibacillus sp. YPD9-1]UJF36097.1 peptidylprolyl isomerase [Paenibacillus sp. YPD9-1]